MNEKSQTSPDDAVWQRTTALSVVVMELLELLVHKGVFTRDEMDARLKGYIPLLENQSHESGKLLLNAFRGDLDTPEGGQK